eukprot:12137774-Heterocapsa_arctica.AAC.1
MPAIGLNITVKLKKWLKKNVHSKIRVRQGSQSQDEDRNGRRIARNKNRVTKNSGKGSPYQLAKTYRAVPIN